MQPEISSLRRFLCDFPDLKQILIFGKSIIMDELTYLHKDLLGFTGIIKQVTSDFKVWELSKKAVSCYNSKNKKQNKSIETPKTSVALNTLKSCCPDENIDKKALTQEENVKFICDSDWCQNYISTALVSWKTQIELQEFAKDVLNGVNKTQQIYLGEFETSKERLLVHKTIQFLHPQLQPETAFGSVSVRPCKLFIVLKPLIGIERTVSLLQYLNVTSKEDKETQDFTLTGRMENILCLFSLACTLFYTSY